MTTKHTSKTPEPLGKGEYFDHINDCEVREVIWKQGHAYCPECGEGGCVYLREGDGPDPLIEHLSDQKSTWIDAGSKGRCVVCSDAYQKGDRVLFFPITETNMKSAVACRQCGALLGN